MRNILAAIAMLGFSTPAWAVGEHSKVLTDIAANLATPTGK